MLLFRSEEHVERWCRDWRFARGAVLTLAQCWQLAEIWYSHDRRDLAWRRFTMDEAHDIFRRVGLTGDFWKLG
ncbi:MAG TPA: hypothetical protein VEJ41_01705 [Candidatus Acidoferrales bacterium]|nr:hypothetical protein [Candidatus Acidoferrales bacterium]